MDCFRKLDLFLVEVGIVVFRKLVRENQHAVERRAQLVRHVGQKFRFVFRSQRQLLGLFFHFPASFFHFAVLGFYFGLLPRQQRGLLLQLLVRLLQFFLLTLQQLFRLAQRFGLLFELLIGFLEFILLALQF